MDIIAICGLDCAVCPAYAAHITDDWGLREATAKEWSTAYGFECKPEMIDCVGCTTVDGVHIGHCHECAIRKCGLERGVVNCAVCELFEGCAIIGDFLAKVPQAKENLEKARASAKAMPEAEPRPILESKTKPTPKLKAKPKRKPKPKSKPAPKRKLRSKPRVKPKAKPKARPRPKPQAKAKAKVKAKSKSKAKPKAKVKRSATKARRSR
jgi:hypothetical protein